MDIDKIKLGDALEHKLGFDVVIIDFNVKFDSLKTEYIRTGKLICRYMNDGICLKDAFTINEFKNYSYV